MCVLGTLRVCRKYVSCMPYVRCAYAVSMLNACLRYVPVCRKYVACMP